MGIHTIFTHQIFFICVPLDSVLNIILARLENHVLHETKARTMVHYGDRDKHFYGSKVCLLHIKEANVMYA